MVEKRRISFMKSRPQIACQTLVAMLGTTVWWYGESFGSCVISRRCASPIAWYGIAGNRWCRAWYRIPSGAHSSDHGPPGIVVESSIWSRNVIGSPALT